MEVRRDDFSYSGVDWAIISWLTDDRLLMNTAVFIYETPFIIPGSGEPDGVGFFKVNGKG